MLFRRVRAEFSDGVIDLLPLRLYPPEKEMDSAACMTI